MKLVNKESQKLNLFDVIVVYIGVISLTNVLLLTIEAFKPILSVVISSILVGILVVYKRMALTIKEKRFGLVIILICVIAFVLRLSPNLYLTGGQDQGTYVSLSKQYDLNKSLYIEDELRDLFDSEAQEMYDKYNVLLGIERQKESSYVMPFYPILPSLMSLFGNIYGSDNRVFAITFMSIISILAIYLFSYEISGRNKNVGLLAAFLLAINPLHVYFSRLPYTEIVSLCFFLLSFYYLIRFYNNFRNNIIDNLSLPFFLLFSLVMFFTRMSGLIILPVIVLIALLSKIYLNNKKVSNTIFFYSIMWIVLLFCSYLYYFIYLPDLFQTIAGEKIIDIIGLPLILIISVTTIFITVAVFVSVRLQRRLRTIFNYLASHIGTIFIVIFISLIIYQIWNYVNVVCIKGVYELTSFESLSYLKRLSFITTILYLSPVGFLLFSIGIFLSRKNTDIMYILFQILIILLVFFCWGYLKLTQYHYYYARYQISEFVPLIIIFVSMFIINLKVRFKKYLWMFLVLFTIPYFIFFSVIQLRSYEGADKNVFEYIDEKIDDKDVLFVIKKEFTSFNQIVFPLKYYYGINIFPLKELDQIDYPEIRRHKDLFDKIYVLSASPDQETGKLKYIQEIIFKHNYFVHCRRAEDKFFVMSGHSPNLPFCENMIIPNRYYYGEAKLYLYELLWNKDE